MATALLNGRAHTGVVTEAGAREGPAELTMTAARRGVVAPSLADCETVAPRRRLTYLLSATQLQEGIRRTLSPELINRLDETLVFRPLTSDHIHSIARTMVDDQLRRMAGLGYELSVDDSVIEHLAVTGYDPSFGARHLQRNVDRQLLVPLALAGPGDEFHAQLVDGEVRWASTATQELAAREGTHTAR